MVNYLPPLVAFMIDLYGSLSLDLDINFEQRALPIRILTVGKKRSAGVQLIVNEYLGKLKHYCSVDDVQVRSNPKNAR